MTRERMTALMVAIAATMLWGPNLGVPIGAIAAIALERLLPRLQSQEALLREQRITRELPLALDLLALALDAGASWERATRVSAMATGGALEEEFAVAAARFALGACADEVWQGSPALELVGQVVQRSFRSGAAVSQLLHQQADALRADERARRLRNVRRLETSILMPVTMLGIPAFLVGGIIPMAVSMFIDVGFAWLSTGTPP